MSRIKIEMEDAHLVQDGNRCVGVAKVDPDYSRVGKVNWSFCTAVLLI